MARMRMVTRTIETTVCTVMTLNTETAEVTYEKHNVDVNHKDNPLKYIQKMFDTDTCKHVAITDSQTIEQIYGLEEAEFLKYARPIER